MRRRRPTQHKPVSESLTKRVERHFSPPFSKTGARGRQDDF